VSTSRRAVFLDRDGTLNVERDLVRRPEELELLPGVSDALRSLSEGGYALIVVTNQSALARGWISEDELSAVHDHLRSTLSSHDVSIDDIVHCPHHPTEGEPPLRKTCDCRKPEPGLLFEAAERHGLDLARSWMVGDAIRDMEAGRRAGVSCLMVRTGKGAEDSSSLDPSMVVEDLTAAAKRILSGD
jgi:D-glycero-D-manno-heptose 1,7-bisphosphate phosphatase